MTSYRWRSEPQTADDVMRTITSSGLADVRVGDLLDPDIALALPGDGLH
jgi:hypothetical protein